MRRSIRLMSPGATAGLSSSACARASTRYSTCSTARPRLTLAFLVTVLLVCTVLAAELPVLVHEDFETGSARWQPPTPGPGVSSRSPGATRFGLLRQSSYSPPHRSPLNFALLKDVIVADFALEAEVQSTVKDYDHRDMVMVFGYQDPAHFYYVHFGNKADDHANQIFIVNNAPREDFDQHAGHALGRSPERRDELLFYTHKIGSFN